MDSEIKASVQDDINSIHLEITSETLEKQSEQENKSPVTNNDASIVVQMPEQESPAKPTTEDEKIGNNTIPDGGWGWVVLAAACFIRVVMSGVYVSFALFTKDFITEFETTPSVLSWMISIYSAIALIAAPVASKLAMRFGHRMVSIFGLVIAGLAYPATYFYPTLWFNFLTGSIIVPFSHGLANMCLSVILTTYFQKRLSIAMGVFSCGSGVASFAVTPIMSIVVNRFGWRLSKVIYSVLYIFAILSAILLRPVQQEEKKSDNKQPEEKQTQENPQVVVEEEKVAEKIDNFYGSKDSNIYHFISLANIASTLPNINEEIQTEKNIALKKSGVEELNMVNVSLSTLVGMSVASNINLKALTENCQLNSVTVVEPAENKEQVKPSSCIDLLKKPIFLLFLLSNLSSNLAYDTPYLFTKAKGLEMGFADGQATFLLTCLGLGNIIGRLGFGFIGSKKNVNTYILNSFCLIIAGLCILLNKVAFSHSLMVTFSIGFGIFIGGNVTLGQVLLVQLLDLRNFSKGLIMLFIIQAVGLFFGTPIFGAIYNATKSFTWPFMICGTVTVASGLLLLLAFLSKKFREEQRNK